MFGIGSYRIKPRRMKLLSKPLDDRKIKVIQGIGSKTSEDRNEERILRVAAYARVSTDTKEQETSFDSQVRYYTDLINKNSDWKLVEIYADPAVSGTSRRNRQQFDKMIYDCLHGKIDLIITKSMSRFARNQLDSLAVIRLLKGLHPPVTVLFEDDKINSSDLSTEVVMTFFSMLAEQESAKKSDNVKWGLERRKENGYYLTPTQNLLGYDKTQAINKDEREMYIVEEEAKVVRIIYKMFLAGYRVSEIAYHMTASGVKTAKKSSTWNSGSILGILRNERYAGDVRTNKSYIESYRDHRTHINKGERSYIYETDHHPAIVTHDEYEMTQKLLASHKYGYDPFVTGSFTLRALYEGLLMGFIPINIHWAGSSLQEYIALSSSIESNDSTLNQVKVRCFPGFEVVRPQDIGHAKKGSIKITPTNLTFSIQCLETFNTDFIEILFNPKEKLIAIRPTHEQMSGAIRWCKLRNEKLVPNTIGCASFTKLLYELMEWPSLWNISVLAQTYSREDEALLLFDLTQHEINALPYAKLKPKKEKTNTDIFYDIELMIAQQIEILQQKRSDSITLEQETEIENKQPTPKRKRLHQKSWYYTFGQKSVDVETQCRRYHFSHLQLWNIYADSSPVEGFNQHVKISNDEIRNLLNALSDHK